MYVLNYVSSLCITHTSNTDLFNIHDCAVFAGTAINEITFLSLPLSISLFWPCIVIVTLSLFSFVSNKEQTTEGS